MPRKLVVLESIKRFPLDLTVLFYCSPAQKSLQGLRPINIYLFLPHAHTTIAFFPMV
jgi:hypothetical protein